MIRSFKPQTRGATGFSGWLAVSSEPDDFGKLTLIDFESSSGLESLETFTQTVGNDSRLSEEFNLRNRSILRGNALVVPIGEGLLYVQPVYLDSGGQLPKLFQVVVGLGDGKVEAGDTFEAALAALLGGGEGDSQPDATLAQLIERAAGEFAAYQSAIGDGRYEEAGRRLAAAQRLIERARALSRQQQQDRPGGSGGG